MGEFAPVMIAVGQSQTTITPASACVETSTGSGLSVRGAETTHARFHVCGCRASQAGGPCAGASWRRAERSAAN